MNGLKPPPSTIEVTDCTFCEVGPVQESGWLTLGLETGRGMKRVGRSYGVRVRLRTDRGPGVVWDTASGDLDVEDEVVGRWCAGRCDDDGIGRQ